MMWFVVWIACAIVCSIVAGNKDRSAAGWFVLGLLLGPLAVLFIAVMPTLAKPKIAPELKELLELGLTPEARETYELRQRARTMAEYQGTSDERQGWKLFGGIIIGLGILIFIFKSCPN